MIKNRADHCCCIDCRCINVAYRNREVLSQISKKLYFNKSYAVVGPNGAGKSTLIKAMMGQIPLSSGSLEYHQCMPNGFSYLPQVNGINREFPVSVLDLVCLGHWKTYGAFRSMKQTKSTAFAALNEVGLKYLESRQISQLSSGQFQRVLFARLILQDSRIIILDEPFSGVDVETEKDLLQLMEKWRKQNRCVITILHDIQTAKNCFTEVILLNRQIIKSGSASDVLTPRYISLAYSANYMGNKAS